MSIGSIQVENSHVALTPLPNHYRNDSNKMCDFSTVG